LGGSSLDSVVSSFLFRRLPLIFNDLLGIEEQRATDVFATDDLSDPLVVQGLGRKVVALHYLLVLLQGLLQQVVFHFAVTTVCSPSVGRLCSWR
jgi:hypothetical protein